jgi:hypothetical protein
MEWQQHGLLMLFDSTGGFDQGMNGDVQDGVQLHWHSGPCTYLLTYLLIYLLTYLLSYMALQPRFGRGLSEKQSSSSHGLEGPAIAIHAIRPP